MKTFDLDALTAVQVAALLGVSDRAIRKWIETKNLPQNPGSGVKTFKWKDVLAWHDKIVRDEVGTGGTTPQSNANPTIPSFDPGDSESYEEALARKTRAEANLKELQLAERRSQVADIDLVFRVVIAANMATQTQLLAVPSRLAARMLGLEDHGRAVSILEAEMRQVLTNLASVNAIREANGAAPADEDEE